MECRNQKSKPTPVVCGKKLNRRVHGVPQSEVEANPWHQEGITILKVLKKYEDKEQGKTKHEAPREAKNISNNSGLGTGTL